MTPDKTRLVIKTVLLFIGIFRQPAAVWHTGGPDRRDPGNPYRMTGTEPRLNIRFWLRIHGRKDPLSQYEFSGT
jgi:hypothetical protein